MKLKNPYSTNRDFLPNPATALYQAEEVEISNLPWIQEIVEAALNLEDKIEGDFDDLEYFRFQIQNNTFGFVRTGLIAFKIKYFKAYKKIAKTFKRFCEDHLHKSHWMINRVIVAAKVVVDLIAAGFDQLPSNEAQCRALMAGCEEDLENLVDEYENQQNSAPDRPIIKFSVASGGAFRA